jgi:hypothetical protein
MNGRDRTGSGGPLHVGVNGDPPFGTRQEYVMLDLKKKIAIAALGLISAGALSAGAASAQTWNQAHPRRAEVNHRLLHQNARIAAGRADGQLSRGQARALHAEDRTIRREERFDARLNGGHITRAEKRGLNQQENAVSRQIYNERH